VLSAFDAAADYEADGQGGPRAWLRWQTRVSRQDAAAVMAWARRLAARHGVASALAAGLLSPSYARRICDWLDQLPAGVQEAAEDILVTAALGGADLAGLFRLFEEIRSRTARPDADGDAGRFGERRLFLDEHFGGHARLDGNLTPACAAALRAVLDSANNWTGPGDLRSRAQRDHDALEEACRLLLAARCLPEREGQPVRRVGLERGSSVAAGPFLQAAHRTRRAPFSATGSPRHLPLSGCRGPGIGDVAAVAVPGYRYCRDPLQFDVAGCDG
jgi:hypothetical protein